MKAKEVAQKLADQAEAVCRHLLPNGRKEGQEWTVGGVDGERGQSLKIHLSGVKSGVWSDFATGDSGDLLDLWCSVTGLSIVEAIRHAQKFLGIFDGYQFYGKGGTDCTPRLEKPKAGPVKDGSAVFDWLTQVRKITREAILAYKLIENGRNVGFPSYGLDGELIACKWRSIDDKKKQWFEKDSAPALFGWQAIPENARSVVITEGEPDAGASFVLGVPALSVPNGANGHKWIESEYENLERFDEIFLSFDMDGPGQAGAIEIASRLGNERCRLVNITPYKDLNDLLKAGFTTSQFRKCLECARTLDPKELRAASSLVDAVVKEFYPPPGTISGFETPWAKARGKLCHRFGELTVICGINGSAKTHVVNQSSLSAMEEGERVCIFSGEMRPEKTLWRMTRQATTLEDPTIPFIRAVHEWYSDRLWIFDLLGSAKVERLLEVFRYAHKRYGIRVFVVDSLMKCGLATDDYTGQKQFVEALCDFKNEFNCHVFLICHPRKGDDESKPIGKMDVGGTGAITDLADNVITIFRNRPKEEKVQEFEAKREPVPDVLKNAPDAIYTVHKQRNGDWEKKLALWWHQESFQLLESQTSKPHQYVKFSQVVSAEVG